MTEDELTQKLAAASCAADGRDPIVESAPANVVQNYRWMQYEIDARRFLVMMKAYEEAKNVQS